MIDNMIDAITELKNKLKKEKIKYNEYYETISKIRIKYMHIKIEDSIPYIVKLEEFKENTEEQKV
jgi:hypothetical protein